MWVARRACRLICGIDNVGMKKAKSEAMRAIEIFEKLGLQ